VDISEYVVEEGESVYFEEAQASRFAKSIAGDFNPIHDPGSKRFCVPGDLLFSVLLHRYGAAQSTSVQFAGMLDGKTRIALPRKATQPFHVMDARDKPLLSLFQTGHRFLNTEFISLLCEQYVQFSGQTFPGILVPLMHSANVMINPDRPLVIYKDMTIELNEYARDLFAENASGDFDEWISPPPTPMTLALSDSDISVNGRKGAVRLQFSIDLAGQQIGSGEKNMVLSGLREYDAAAMQAIVELYTEWQESYQDATASV